MISRVTFQARVKKAHHGRKHKAIIYLINARTSAPCTMYWRTYNCATLEEARTLAAAWNAKTWDGIPT